jgi:hypothetical protein
MLEMLGILHMLEVMFVGRTVPTFRMILEHVIHDWYPFRRALRANDKKAFDAMMLHARQHAAAASNAARLNPTEALLMAILVEHEKELRELRELRELSELSELSELRELRELKELKESKVDKTREGECSDKGDV